MWALLQSFRGSAAGVRAIATVAKRSPNIARGAGTGVAAHPDQMMVWGADCGIMAMSGTDARGFAVAGHRASLQQTRAR
jgi:hypothetical protein